jgi:hypothetical protein
MIATTGLAAATNDGVEDDVEPWWPTFRRSTGPTSPRARSVDSTGASASPVSRAEKPPISTVTTSEPLLMSPSGSGDAASVAEG